MSWLQPVAASVDRDAILSEYESVANWFPIHGHTFPKPVWARRRYEHTGAEAWQEVRRRLDGKKKDQPLSIYIHVPFCRGRCGFCDLYSLSLSARNRQLEDEFVERLLDEIGTWLSIGPLDACPVTTVHFGGGTPNCLSPSNLGRIAAALRRGRGIGPKTEWALESTCRLLTDAHLRQLRDLGFTRLHAGVQTLDDRIRRTIGRKEGGDSIVRRLDHALAGGFVVSVDLLYWLPGQTPQLFMDTLERLTATGVHGFSLYQLQVCARNRAFLQRCGGDRQNPLLNYALFQIGEHSLNARGYRKNFFTHWALPPDRNLYYRHVLRGEDLLAFGPTADGVIGHYLYRHPEYRAYMQSPVPGLEGGMMETPVEQQMRSVAACLMTGAIEPSTLHELDASPLLDLWTVCDFLRNARDTTMLSLTANGSWFMTQMLNQLRKRVGSAQTEQDDSQQQPSADSR